MNEHRPDEDPKRPASLLDQALHAADALVSEVQHRMPPELLNQLRAGQRQIDQRMVALQNQLRRSATKAEMERLSRRIEQLAGQVEELARRVETEARTSSRRPTLSTRSAQPRPAPSRTSNSRSRGARETNPAEPSTRRAARSRGPRDANTAEAPARRTARTPKPDSGNRRTPRTRSRKPPSTPPTD